MENKCIYCGRFNRKRKKCSLIHGCFNFKGWRPSPKYLNMTKDLRSQLKLATESLQFIAKPDCKCLNGNCNCYSWRTMKVVAQNTLNILEDYKEDLNE